MSRVLVYQANGVQGAATVRRVRQAGYTTRVLIRNKASAAGFIDQGIEVAIADLTDRAALARAHEAVDQVILQIPAYGDAFVRQTIGNAVAAMESARVKSVIVKLANPTPAVLVPDSGFSANLVIREEMRACAIPHCIIEPTMYLDTFLKPSLRAEISRDRRIDLPLASNLKIAWTTVDDAAKMAVQVLQSESRGLTLRCAGGTAYDGQQLALEFSAVLGRRIEYVSTPIGGFQRDIESAIGLVAAAPVVSKFRFLAGFPEEAQRMLGGTFAAEDGLDGFEPTRVRDWIRANRASFGA